MHADTCICQHVEFSGFGLASITYNWTMLLFLGQNLLIQKFVFEQERFCFGVDYFALNFQVSWKTQMCQTHLHGVRNTANMNSKCEFQHLCTTVCPQRVICYFNALLVFSVFTQFLLIKPQKKMTTFSYHIHPFSIFM